MEVLEENATEEWAKLLEKLSVNAPISTRDIPSILLEASGPAQHDGTLQCIIVSHLPIKGALNRLDEVAKELEMSEQNYFR